MALTNTYKDEAHLTFKEDSERLELLGRQILRRVMNEAKERLRQIHLENQRNGIVKSVLPEQTEVEHLLRDTTLAELPESCS
jgi:hypothetical protein